MRVLNQSGRQFFMSKNFCACLSRSKFFSTVFELHDQGSVAQSFNIFIDVELSELTNMVSIAETRDGKKGMIKT